MTMTMRRAGTALALILTLSTGGTDAAASDQQSEGKEGTIWTGPSTIGDWHLAPRSSDADLNEDETGWNCYTNGNGSCGTYLMKKGRGFITRIQTSAMPSDACIYYSDYPEYVMCRDGRVYLKGPGPLI